MSLVSVTYFKKTGFSSVNAFILQKSPFKNSDYKNGCNAFIVMMA